MRSVQLLCACSTKWSVSYLYTCEWDSSSIKLSNHHCLHQRLEAFQANKIEFINRMHCYYKIVFNLAFNMYTIHRFCHAVCFIGIGVVPVERNHKISAHIKCRSDFKEVSHFEFSLCVTIISIVLHVNFIIDWNSWYFLVFVQVSFAILIRFPFFFLSFFSENGWKKERCWRKSWRSEKDK